MSTELILQRLYDLGLTITVVGDRLTVRPKDILTDEIRQTIRDHKPNLIRLLLLSQSDHPDLHKHEGDVTCLYCRHCGYVDYVNFGRHDQTCVCTLSGKPLVGIPAPRKCAGFSMEMESG